MSDKKTETKALG